MIKKSLHWSVIRFGRKNHDALTETKNGISKITGKVPLERNVIDHVTRTDYVVANDGDDGGDGYVEFRIEFIENIAERHK